MSEDGEYYTKGKVKIATVFLNFLSFDNEYWNKMLLRKINENYKRKDKMYKINLAD